MNPRRYLPGLEAIMNAILRLYQSSLGKKYVMAITGLALFGFVIGHLAGNLQVFLGKEYINDYAQLLKSKPALIWTARIGLLVMVGLHIGTAISLTRMNRKARPFDYDDSKPFKASYASRTMMMSGLIITAFVIFHLLHYTTLTIDPSFKDLEETLADGTHRHDVYAMLVHGFSHIWVSVWYIVAMGLLCLHLSHGIASVFQSLGLKSAATEVFLSRTAKVVSGIIFLGYISIPVAVLTGFLKIQS
jgi:succinate dehydrogenase / fumarate reductase cytochrome b subunit